MDLVLEVVQQNAMWEKRQRDSRNRIDLNVMIGPPKISKKIIFILCTIYEIKL